MLLFIFYLLIPLILISLFHYYYIKLGLFVSKTYISKKILKILFLFIYLVFGIILLYTDYIWNSYPKTKQKNNVYSILKKENSNHKITVSGFVNPQLDIKFATYLNNSEDRCKEKSQYKYISVRSETPLIKDDTFKSDIFLEYLDKKTNCKYLLSDIFILLYKKELNKEHYFTFESIEYDSVNITCYEKYEETECSIKKANENSKKLDFKRLNDIKINIKVDGEISGLSDFNKKKNVSVFYKLINKFQILGTPSFK